MNFIYKVFFIILLFISCADNQKQSVVLEIGKYVLTASDFKAIIKGESYKLLNSGELERKLIEEGRILAYAKDNRFDTIGILKKQLVYAERYYASKVEGYVWNQKVKPQFNISDDDINKAYAKKNIEYSLDILNFPSKKSIEKYLSFKTSTLTEKDFIRLRKEINSNPDVGFLSRSMSYPFYPFGAYTDKIIGAKKGDVIGPLESLNGYYIIYVSKVNKNAWFGARSRIEPILKQELLYTLRDKYVWESQKEIMNQTKPVIYEPAVIKLASSFDSKRYKFVNIDKSLILMNYAMGAIEENYTVADFEEFIQCQPVFIGSLNSSEDIKRMLKTFLIGKFLHRESIKLGMHNNPDFKTFKKTYQQKLFIHFYKEKYKALEKVRCLKELKIKYPIITNQIGYFISQYTK